MNFHLKINKKDDLDIKKNTYFKPEQLHGRVRLTVNSLPSPGNGLLCFFLGHKPASPRLLNVLFLFSLFNCVPYTLLSGVFSSIA